ncbi:hypothetical protein M758_3G170600 [Ceratodon purpureus]|nr:hypothetical protein M758_3G170600 [Ceratodon purpureus]
MHWIPLDDPLLLLPLHCIISKYIFSLSYFCSTPEALLLHIVSSPPPLFCSDPHVALRLVSRLLVMASWEAVIRDGPLVTMLRQMTVSPSPWDYADFVVPPHLPSPLCSIADIENARGVSPRWRELIDNSAEWAAVRLARYDYSNDGNSG